MNTLKLKQLVRKRAEDSKGQSMVEFAIILPVVLLILIGLIEWGFVLWTNNMFVNATRDGARKAAVFQDWNINAAADTELVKDVVEDRLVGALPPSLIEGIRDNISVELLPSAANMNSIRVTINDQPYAPVLGLTIAPLPQSLSATAEFHLEGASCGPGSC